MTTDRSPCLSAFIALRRFPCELFGPQLRVHGCLLRIDFFSDLSPFCDRRYNLGIDYSSVLNPSLFVVFSSLKVPHLLDNLLLMGHVRD